MSPLGLRSAKKKKEGEAGRRQAGQTAQTGKARQAGRPHPLRGVVVEKPKADIYTVLLILSFVALVIGCLCLYPRCRATT